MTRITIISLSLAFFGGQAAFSLPACGFGHCTQFDVLLKKICFQKYGQGSDLGGKTLETYENGNPCLCPCSCAVPETLISLAGHEEVLIRTLQKGDTVVTPQALEAWADVYGAIGAKVENATIREILFSNDRLIRVSPNHTFVRPQGTLVKADALKVNEAVLDGFGSTVKVVQTRLNRSYRGALFNFIVNPSSENPTNHVITNNGIQSGDWLLQTTQDQLKAELDLRTGNVITADQIVRQ